jgi:hypothetical protein
MEHCRQDGKLERIFSQTPGEDPVTHQDLRYSYDENGNITQILDYASADPQTEEPLTQDFEYDALDRLTYAIVSKRDISTQNRNLISPLNEF